MLLDESITSNVNEQNDEMIKYTNYNNVNSKNNSFNFIETNNVSKELTNKKNDLIKENKTSSSFDDKHLPLKKRKRFNDYNNYEFKFYKKNKILSNADDEFNIKINTSKKQIENLESNEIIPNNRNLLNNVRQINNGKCNNEVKNDDIKYTKKEINELNNEDLSKTKSLQDNDVTITDIVYNNKITTNLNYSLNDIILHINSEVRSLSSSNTFMVLFKIMEQDLINILKNAYQYFYKENKGISDLIHLLEKNNDNERKILNFVNVIKILLNSHFEYNQIIDSDIGYFLNSILKTSYLKTSKYKDISNKFTTKCNSLKYYIENKTLTNLDVLKYTIYTVNNLTDENFKQLCLFGIQNFLIINFKNVPKFYYILILLYTYINENKYYDIDWDVKLFKILAIKPFYFRIYNNLITALNFIFNNKNEFLFYRIYFAINSKDAYGNLHHYTELQKNKSHFNLLNNLLDILNEVKYKLYKINK